jgi:hypothetical protein
VLNVINLLIKIKNKKQNKFIVSEKLYIGITDTINGFRSTLACCEVACRHGKLIDSLWNAHHGRVTLWDNGGRAHHQSAR